MHARLFLVSLFFSFFTHLLLLFIYCNFCRFLYFFTSLWRRPHLRLLLPSPLSCVWRAQGSFCVIWWSRRRILLSWRWFCLVSCLFCFLFCCVLCMRVQMAVYVLLTPGSNVRCMCVCESVCVHALVFGLISMSLFLMYVCRRRATRSVEHVGEHVGTNFGNNSFLGRKGTSYFFSFNKTPHNRVQRLYPFVCLSWESDYLLSGGLFLFFFVLFFWLLFLLMFALYVITFLIPLSFTGWLGRDGSHCWRSFRRKYVFC